MPRFYIARKPKRIAVMLPLGGTKEKPNIIIPLKGLNENELDELVSALLEKRGMEGAKSKLNELIEEGYEHRIKTAEASEELRMRIEEQARFPKLKYGGLRPPRKRR